MYRFRRIDQLFGDKNELENQYIYFAPPEKLNDPMEGYRDVFWKGDKIVWKNLVINYARSLEYTFMVALLYPKKQLSREDLLVWPNPVAYTALGKNSFMERISGELFKNEFISRFPEQMAARVSPVRYSELVSHLELIHPFVLDVISDFYIANGILKKPLVSKDLLDLDALRKKSERLIPLIDKLEIENSSILNAGEKFFTAANFTSQQIRLLTKYNHYGKGFNANTFFLISEYPVVYLGALDSILYPQWYIASFISGCFNSAVWGHYGDSHRGVCLKFKTFGAEDKPEINLETEYGYSSGPIIGMRPHAFQKVRYQDKHVEIDFFRSIARMSRMVIEKLWYTDELGNISECASHFTEGIEEWRNSYWDNHGQSITTKLNEWEYEKEYRLIVSGDLIDYSTKEKRKLKYDFNDLISITFGIKTSDEDKIKIIKVIEAKCKTHNRKEFDFYQAYYSKEDGKIKSHKLSLIKFE